MNDDNTVFDPTQSETLLADTPPAEASAFPVAGDTPEDPVIGPGSDINLDMILDVPVTLSLEIGRTKMPIRNLLQLNQGSVVELERGAGEALDVYVNGTLIAHGEVVVINDRFGMRLTDIVSPSERIRRLR